MSQGDRNINTPTGAACFDALREYVRNHPRDVDYYEPATVVDFHAAISAAWNAYHSSTRRARRVAEKLANMVESLFQWFEGACVCLGWESQPLDMFLLQVHDDDTRTFAGCLEALHSLANELTPLDPDRGQEFLSLVVSMCNYFSFPLKTVLQERVNVEVEIMNRDSRENGLRPRIYISGPITKGDREANFQQATDAHKALMTAGYAVLNPMLTMRFPDAFAIPHDTWIANDLPWVAVADAVLRLPGESKGADVECEHAIIHGIPVFYDEAELRRFFSELQRRAKQNAR